MSGSGKWPKHLRGQNMDLAAVLVLIAILALVGGIVEESARTH
jgi:hypothetical protein